MPKPTAKAKRVKAGTGTATAADRRKAFVDAYITNGRNGTQAAITAGYSPKTATVKAAQLLAEVNVRALVEARVDECSRITGLTTERTLLEVARIAYFDPRKTRNPDGSFIPLQDLDDDTAAAVAGEEVETITGRRGEDEADTEGAVLRNVKRKYWDKNAALEKAMKYHGLYREDNAQRGENIRVVVELV